MRHAMMTMLLLSACTNSSGGGDDGIDATSHVEQIESPGCFTGMPFDSDPNTPGDQYECSVSEPNNGAVFPQCNNVSMPSSSTNMPCWAVVMDTLNCTGAPMGVRLTVLPDQLFSAQCLVH
jgi:hypothetical protein